MNIDHIGHKADYVNTYSEHLAEIAEGALDAIDSLFGALVDAAQVDGEVDPNIFFRTGPALVSHARQEILGAIGLLENLLGGVLITRASHDNRLGLEPKTMIAAEIIRRPNGGTAFEKGVTE